jgi:hypothetical protein
MIRKSGVAKFYMPTLPKKAGLPKMPGCQIELSQKMLTKNVIYCKNEKSGSP